VSASTSSSSPGARTKVGGIEIDRRFAWLTAALLGLVFGLSSIPDLDDTFQGPVWSFLANAIHAPLFGAVAYCCYRTLSPRRTGSWVVLAATFVATAAYGALDEWHQSYVVGRDASLSDLLVDIAGIAGVLIVIAVARHRLTGRRAGTPRESPLETQQ
jgi:VanZ family protein